MNKVPNVLTIAGSDCGGGAGIQADIKTMTVLGNYAMSVITALTAQNGLGVQGIAAVDPDFVALQLKSILDCFPVAAAKTGMLFSADVINSIQPLLIKRDFPLVVDPVCVSQSGHKLLEDSAVEALITKIIPLADLITPNIPEAELISGQKIKNNDDIQKVGELILKLGAKAVLIKGGHSESKNNTLIDWLIMPNANPEPLLQAYVDTINNHGTGCTLSAAITSYLASGHKLHSSIQKAQSYIYDALLKSYTPGCGIGPVNHFAPFA